MSARELFFLDLDKRQLQPLAIARVEHARRGHHVNPLEAGEINHNQIRQVDKTSTERDRYMLPSTTCVNDADWGREFDEVIFEKDHA